MGGRGEELMVGLVCALLAFLLIVRIGRALRTGEVPLYRTKLTRKEAGSPRFFALIGINILLFMAMFVIAADLVLQLDLRSG